MKINKTTLLFIATLFFLAMPLAFTAGNAGAAQFVHNDGATHNANGGYQLPAGVCTGDTTFLTTGTQTASTLAGVTTDVACQAQLNTVAVAAGLASSAAITQTLCTNNGLSWSTRHNNCSNVWDTVNPDTGVFYGSDGTISGNQGCLRCHNTDYMTAGSHDLIAAKERYLLTGHRNMLRKVTTPYAQWLNGDTAVSTPNGTLPAGTPISMGNVDWTSSNSTVPGFPLVSGATPYALPANTAYEWGGWWGNKKAGQILRQPAATDAPSTAAVGGSYTCSQCHTTGWDTAGTSSTPAQTDQPGGLVNTGGSTWIYEGVQCSRCHDYSATATIDAPLTTGVYNNSHNNGVLPENEQSTQLCFQCHNQEIQPYATANVSDVAVGGHGGYAAAFAGHYRTNQFLNSPHAQFTGTEDQVGSGAYYAAKWQAGTCSDSFLTNKTDCTSAGDTWTSMPNDNNGCVTCHDVHVSSVDPDVMDPTNGTYSNIKAGGMCGTSCHASTDLSKINHPIAPGTPLDGDLNTAKGRMKACVTCHMAKNLNHLFRINTSASYTPFPTKAQYTAGQKTANTFPDGSYTKAVWMDVDLACGQCHGGDTNGSCSDSTYTSYPTCTAAGKTWTPTTNGAPFMSKAYLSAIAPTMHQNSASGPATVAVSPAPASDGTVAPSAVSGYTVTLTDTSLTSSYSHSPDGGVNISVNWNDGTVTTGVSGDTFTHTYTAAGTFTIKYTGEANGKYTTIFMTVAVPNTSNQQITGTVSGYAGFDASNTNIYLKQNGITKQIASTTSDGLFTFNTAPGSYTVQAYKYGVTFTEGNVQAATVTAGNSTALTFTAVQTKFSLGVTSNLGAGAVVMAKYNGVTKGLQQTDTNGAATFNNLTAGTYTVTAFLKGYTCTDQIVVLPGGSASFTCTAN
jgi:cytochrome c551/c552